MIPRKHHFWSFLAITIPVCQIQVILTLIPFQNELHGWGYAQNTKILFRAEMIPRKHDFWSFLAITIAVCQVQMILTLIPLQNEHDGMRICAKQKFFFRAEMIPRKHHFWSFLAITIAVCQIQMILTLIQIFFQSGNDSYKTSFLVVFGYNNCSVSNPSDFNNHTSSK